jgi:uncharacterized membrane protein
MIIENSVTIQKPIFDVFRMATDFDSFATWQPATKLVKVTPNDPVRTGSMIYMEKSLPTGLTFINADLIDYQRNKVMEMKGVFGRFKFTRKTEFITSGRDTIVKDRLEMPTGCIYFWYAPLLRRMIEGQTKREWAVLKQRLEGK